MRNINRQIQNFVYTIAYKYDTLQFSNESYLIFFSVSKLYKEIDTSPSNHYSKKRVTLFFLHLLPLLCIIHSLVLIVFP